MTEALWALGRGTGVVALVLLTGSMLLGIGVRSGRPQPLGRSGLHDLHRSTALTAVGLVLVHMLTLLLDPYAQLRVVDLVVPFLGAQRPLWLGLGTLATDLVLVVVAVSLLRHRVGPRVFRLVHWATYALWPIAVLHTVGDGTDRSAPWLLALVAACTLSVAGALVWRLSDSYDGRGHRRLPRVVVREGALR